MEELDLFADVGVLEAETADPADKEPSENPKAYQLVDLHDGSYLLKKYNGYKATPKYYIIGHFKLRAKSLQQYYKERAVSKRKEEAKALGNATVRRAETNVLKQAHEIAMMLNSVYEFEKSENCAVEMTDYLDNLIEKITQDLNAKYKKDKITAEIEMLNELSMLDLDNALLSDEQIEKVIMAVYILHTKVELFCKKQNKNREEIVESHYKKLFEKYDKK